MCKVDHRCAAHTRGPYREARTDFHSAWGAEANAPSPLEHIEASYDNQRTAAARQQGTAAQPATPGPEQGTPATTDRRAAGTATSRAPRVRFANPAQAQRAAMLQSAMGRCAGASAVSAMSQVRQSRSGDRLRDPSMASAAAATQSASGRASGSAAYGAMTHVRDSGVQQGLARSGASAQAAGTRVAASGAASALSVLRSKG